MHRAIDKTSKMVCWLGQIGAGFESKIGSISMFRENKIRLITLKTWEYVEIGDLVTTGVTYFPFMALCLCEVFSLRGSVSMIDIFAMASHYCFFLFQIILWSGSCGINLSG